MKSVVYYVGLLVFAVTSVCQGTSSSEDSPFERRSVTKFSIGAARDEVQEIEFHAVTGFTRPVCELLQRIGVNPCMNWPVYCRETGQIPERAASYIDTFTYMMGMIHFINADITTSREAIASEVKIQIANGSAILDENVSRLEVPDPSKVDILSTPFLVKLPDEMQRRTWSGVVSVGKQNYSKSRQSVETRLAEITVLNIRELNTTSAMSKACSLDMVDTVDLIKAEAHFFISLISETWGILYELVRCHQEILLTDIDMARLSYLQGKGQTHTIISEAKQGLLEKTEKKMKKQKDLQEFLLLISSVYREPSKPAKTNSAYAWRAADAVAGFLTSCTTGIPNWTSREGMLNTHFHPLVTLSGVQYAYQCLEWRLRGLSSTAVVDGQPQLNFDKHRALMITIFGENPILPTQEEFRGNELISIERIRTI